MVPVLPDDGHRALPAGPTILDEVANAAFFFGLMCAVTDEYGDVKNAMPFDDAKANFMAAARYGLHARLHWFGGKTYGAEELILNQLLPIAREGLLSHEIAREIEDQLEYPGQVKVIVIRESRAIEVAK